MEKTGFLRTFDKRGLSFDIASQNLFANSDSYQRLFQAVDGQETLAIVETYHPDLMVKVKGSCTCCTNLTGKALEAATSQ